MSRSTATMETKFVMFVHKLNISQLNNMKNQDNRAGRSLTNCWWYNSVCTKPMLPCIFDCLPPQHNFPPIPFKLGDHGSSFHTISFTTDKFGAVLLIPVSEEKFLRVNRGWRTKTWTHAIAPFIFSWSIATLSRDTVKMKCDSDGPLTTSAVNWNTWTQHMWKIMRRPRWLEKPWK